MLAIASSKHHLPTITPIMSKYLDAVVHSIVSVTSFLRGQLVRVFYDIINRYTDFFIIIFKMQKLLTFLFQQYILAYLGIKSLNFNEILTNDVVSIEQLGSENGSPSVKIEVR